MKPAPLSLVMALVIPAVAVVSTGCAAQRTSQAAKATTTTPDGRVYQLDFVLASTEPGAATTRAAFTVNVAVHERAEIRIGRNVPLSVSAAHGSPRMDVGLHVSAALRTVGEDMLVDVHAELSNVDASSVEKISAKSTAVGLEGRSVLVARFEDARHHYELFMKPTRTRDATLASPLKVSPES